MKKILKWGGIGCGGLVTLIVVIAVIAAVSGGGGQSEEAGAADSASDNSSQSESGQQTETPQAGIGDKIEDGQFTFTVSGVEEAQTLGQGAMATEAQGKYVLVNLTVKNTSNEVATFNAGSSQVAYDSQGREYQTSEDAIMSGDSSDQSSFLQQINPGSSIEGRLVYDVPDQVQLTKVELHGGSFSSGAEVSLQ
ncbi:hypothetical protein BH23ACT11_BH23ACT11_27550 [soil metagenome]